MVQTDLLMKAAPDQLPDGPRWHVLHTLARQEKAVARDLGALGIDHYLPLQEAPRYYGKRKIVSQLPVFPGYVFLRGTLDQAYRADRTGRVARILPVPDQGRLEFELKQIRLALESGAALAPHPVLAKGAVVEVRVGPLRGLVGEVEDPTRPDRLVLRVRTLGQAVSLEIDAALLDVVDPARAA